MPIQTLTAGSRVLARAARRFADRANVLDDPLRLGGFNVDQWAISEELADCALTAVVCSQATVEASINELFTQGIINDSEHWFAGLDPKIELKLENQQEFVIGGYRPGSNGVDALLVGYYDDTGLRFAGKVRAGFVPHLRREVFKALKPHHADECPFVDLPNPKSSRWGGGVTAEEMREMQWVKPELVAQVRFVEWTGEGRLRHAAFLGLRSDKSAREVRRE